MVDRAAPALFGGGPTYATRERGGAPLDEAAELRRDIKEAQLHIDRLQRVT